MRAFLRIAGSGLPLAKQFCPKVVNPYIRLKIEVIPNLAVLVGTEGELGDRESVSFSSNEALSTDNETNVNHYATLP